jgi:tRNA (guanine26-N2/guanine27-N2)-dimethyltransferase
MSSEPSLSPEFAEGKARLQLPRPRGTVFYNPIMSLNRDIAILFLSSYGSIANRLRVCDPMAGSGVRAVRYVLETPNVASVLAADKDRNAALAAERVARLNGVEGRVTVVCEDANSLLLKHCADRFDVVDLDPFGSPAPFFESALRSTKEGGVLAASATDMGPLSGARPTACLRKYGVSPVRTEFEKETALRALASCLVANAARLELGVDIAFSHATDHYARLYATLSKGRKMADHSLRKLGYVAYCPHCLFRTTFSSIAAVDNRCANCRERVTVGGPYWLGQLWDRAVVQRMIERTPLLSSSRISGIQRMLGLIEAESGCPSFYYRTDSIASAYHTKPPSISRVIDWLRNGGYQAARTHFDNGGFRTNAPLPTIVASFLTGAQEAYP